jgi:hypothetical protein
MAIDPLVKMTAKNGLTIPKPEESSGNSMVGQLNLKPSIGFVPVFGYPDLGSPLCKKAQFSIYLLKF